MTAFLEDSKNKLQNLTTEYERVREKKNKVKVANKVSESSGKVLPLDSVYNVREQRFKL